jgi:hypothetical protein
MTDTTNPQQADRRERYAAAIRETDGWVLDGRQHMIDAVMAVADAEQAEMRERHHAGLRRADEINNELMQEVQRYAEGREQPVLWSVYNAMHLRADNAEARAEAMERAMESTAADALKHRGCHRDLMGQCLRAERAEAAVKRVRSYLASQADALPANYPVAVPAADVLAALDEQPASGPGGVAGETQQDGTRKRCRCGHPADEHSIYGCADGCGCEWMPKRRAPMDPVHILGIYADEQPAAASQPDGEA